MGLPVASGLALAATSSTMAVRAPQDPDDGQGCLGQAFLFQGGRVRRIAAAPTLAGYLTLHPGGTAAPLISAINFAAGQTRSNNAVSLLNASGQLGVFCGQATRTVHAIVDVNGYFQ